MQKRILGLLFLGMVAITASCEKQQPAVRKAELSVKNSDTPKTGDDDDDPILQGRVRKKMGLTPVIGAEVNTYLYGSDVLISTQYTNDSGEFTKQVPSGTYYFKVNVPGNSSPYVTETFTISQSTEVTISVD